MHSLAFHDKNQHGTIAFPAEYHYVDCKHPRYLMPFHWHKEWEILRILSGSFHLHLDDTDFSAQPGDVFLIRGGVLHGGTPEDCEYECLVFDLHGLFRSMDSVKGALRPVYRQQLLPTDYFPATVPNKLHRITEELMNIFHTGSDDASVDCTELETIGCISNLFAWILKEHLYTAAEDKDFSSNHRMEQVKTVLEFIENHYGEKLTLEQLSTVAGMNPKYFCRIFRSITHQSPMDYLIEYRIQIAKKLLEGNDLSITDIALGCGFNNNSYFTKIFHRTCGKTPNAYRTELKALQKSTLE